MSDLPGLLQKLERQWVALGVPGEDILLPGLDPWQVADILTRTVGAAPDALVHWFSWHDGSPPGRGWDAAPIGAPILPLAHCLREREVQLTVARDEPSYPGTLLWDPEWLPLSPDTGGGSYAVDTSDGGLIYVSWWSVSFARPLALHVR